MYGNTVSLPLACVAERLGQLDALIAHLPALRQTNSLPYIR
jgi:hypothetical protein